MANLLADDGNEDVYTVQYDQSPLQTQNMKNMVAVPHPRAEEDKVWVSIVKKRNDGDVYTDYCPAEVLKVINESSEVDVFLHDGYGSHLRVDRKRVFRIDQITGEWQARDHPMSKGISPKCGLKKGCIMYYWHEPEQGWVSVRVMKVQ